MNVHFGAENFIENNLDTLKGKNVGLLCNQASVVFDRLNILDALRDKGVYVSTVFFPQHGFFQDKQDNMIESDSFSSEGTRFVSLYGDYFAPQPHHLDNLDVILYDVQDVGARIYTFVSTLKLLLQSLDGRDIRCIVLDRPNPLGGDLVEGNLIDPGYESFVGIHPIPMVYGMSAGELAVYFKSELKLDTQLEVAEMKGWNRAMRFGDTGRFWYPASPNMPVPETALVYPGTVMLEGTSLSEGRGTTRPFEIVGAPFLNPEEFSGKMNELDLPGVHFIPYSFTPTFNKFQDELCHGVFIKVTDSEAFRPYRTGIELLRTVREVSGDAMSWKQPPYEYETEKLPIDVITGSPRVREYIDGDRHLDLDAFLSPQEETFSQQIKQYHLYK